MSLPELIPSNLPQFVRLTPRSAFANSVVPQGCALYFAEPDGSGGAIFLYKNPDGSYTEVGGGGSMSFYKCASVDTTNRKWSGYLASIDSTTGVWSFAETATADLPYDRITPSIGKVYDENCTFAVHGYKTGLPEDGLIFYLPLDTEIGTADAKGGYPLTKSYDAYLSFTTANGIPCLKCEGGAIFGPDLISLFPNDTSARFTITAWEVSRYSGGFGAGFAYSNTGTVKRGVAISNSRFFYEPFDYFIGDMLNTTMSFYVCTYDGQNLTYKKNGSVLRTNSTNTPFGSATSVYPTIGQSSIGSHVSDLQGIAAFRIYNRVLDNNEISALAAEFTPAS